MPNNQVISSPNGTTASGSNGNQCGGPRCDDKCSCRDGASADPIRYFNGEVLYSHIDVEAGLPGFTHARTYRNRRFMGYSQPGANGWDWNVDEWPFLVKREVASSSKVTIIARIGQQSLYFDKSGSDYIARYGAGSRFLLEHDAPNGIFRLTKRSDTASEVIEFYDFTQVTNNWGQMKQRTDRTGYVTTVESYDGDNIAVLRSDRDGFTYRLNYTYDTDGHIIFAKLDRGTTNPATLRTNLRRVRYLYHDGTTTEGSFGDLKAAIVQETDGSFEWADVRVTYYRYYTGRKGDGQQHLLKYIVGPTAYAELVAQGQDPLTQLVGPDGIDLVPSHADHYFVYDDARRVTQELVRRCQACGGSATSGGNTTTFKRSRNKRYSRAGAMPSGDEYFNTWQWKAVESGDGPFEKTVYTNGIGQVMLEVKRFKSGAERGSLIPSDLAQWLTYRQYDAEGREILRAEPTAVIGFDETLPTLVGPQPGGGFTFLRANEGLIHLTTYYNTTTATDSTIGGVAGYVEYTKIKKGTAGTEILQNRSEYIASDNMTGDKVYALARYTTYPDETNQTATQIQTTYTYKWYHSPVVRVYERITNLPPTPDQPGGSIRRELYGDQGWKTVEQDENDIITRMSYDDARGLMTDRWVDQTGAPPTGWPTPPSPSDTIQTTIFYDNLGRPVETRGDLHDALVGGVPENGRTLDRTLYVESRLSAQALGELPVGDQVRSVRGFQSSSWRSIGPATISIRDKSGQETDRILARRTSATNPFDQYEVFPRANWLAWSVMHHDSSGRLTYQRDYHTIPPQSPDLGLDGVNSDPGEPGVNYNETFYGYDESTGMRLRVKTPGGTVTRSLYDGLNRLWQTYVGTNDVPTSVPTPPGKEPLTPTWKDWRPDAPGTDLVLIQEFEYDRGASGGMSNLTAQLDHVNASTRRITRHTYDFRNRRIASDGEANFFESTTYDNMDRVTRTERRLDDASGRLLARTDQLYDNRSRVTEVWRWCVDPDTGNAPRHLTGIRHYDPKGNLTRSVEPGAGVVGVTNRYDHHDRLIQADTGYTANFSGTDVAVVLEGMAVTYDKASNQLTVAHRMNDVWSPNGPPTAVSYRTLYRFEWFDGIGRSLAVQDRGQSSSPPARPSTPPASSSSQPVGSTEYNDRGLVWKVIDPNNRQTRFEYDALGRRTKQIENYSGTGQPAFPLAADNRTTLTAYNADGNVVTLTAVYADSRLNQTTTYAYGVTRADKKNPSALASNLLLAKITYPDSQGDSDVVRLAYNRLGQVTRRIDQAGTNHQYYYDGLGRLTDDCVTAFGASVHRGIKRLSTAYNDLGLPCLFTSYDNATAGRTAGAVNQVQRLYDGFGQVTIEQQAAGKTVDFSSTTNFINPVQTTLAREDGSDNLARPTALIYPDLRTLTYHYGTPGVTPFNQNQVLRISESGSDLVRYSYLGETIPVRVEYAPPARTLDMWGGTVGNYNGLDQQNRVISMPWNGSVLQMAYNYDANSNPLFRNLSPNYAPRDSYQYDGLSRLTRVDRTNPPSGGAGIIDWNLDPLGNWAGYGRSNFDATFGDIDQTRRHNRVNEINNFTPGPTAPDGWADPLYDPAGNTTRIPYPGGVATASVPTPPPGEKPCRFLTYDAWNRLARVQTGFVFAGVAFTDVVYTYDALHRRLVETRPPAPSTNFPRQRRFVYAPGAWQIVEERRNNDAVSEKANITVRQFVWGTRYIDDLVQMKALEPLPRPGGGASNLLVGSYYALTDRMFNVVALTDASGGFVEVYDYLPYGTRLITVAPDPTHGWWGPNRTTQQYAGNPMGHQGLWHDDALQYIHNRMRVLEPSLGRFLQRDPLGYVGMNVYNPYFNSPLNYTDPSGTVSVGEVYIVQRDLWVVTGLRRGKYISEENDFRSFYNRWPLPDCPDHGYGWNNEDRDEIIQTYIAPTLLSGAYRFKWASIMGMFPGGGASGIIVAGVAANFDGYGILYFDTVVTVDVEKRRYRCECVDGSWQIAYVAGPVQKDQPFFTYREDWNATIYQFGTIPPPINYYPGGGGGGGGGEWV